MQLAVEVLGLESFEAELEQSFSEFVRKTAQSIRAEIETSLERTGHTGRTYRRDGRLHIASAPGETPARDSGDLWGSITQVETDGLESSFEIRAGHAGLLEDGTDRLEPRPFVEPAVDLVLEQTLFEL